MGGEYLPKIEPSPFRFFSFSVHADVTAEPVDVNQMKRAIEGIAETIKERPGRLVADTGYGGGENLRYLEEKNIDGYIPEEG